jgi:replicative DNA helicase
MRELYNLEMEQQVLGSVFLTEKCIPDIKTFLKTGDFYDEWHKQIYECMINTFDNGEKIDYTIIIHKLQQKKNINSSNEKKYIEYILNLSNTVASLVNLMEYINIVSSYSQKRNALAKFTDLSEKLEKLDILEIEKEVKEIAKIFNDNTDFEGKDGYSELSDYIDEFINDLETPLNKADVFKLGFKVLDEMVMLEKTNLMIIGADTGVGKTAFALNLAKNFCEQNKKTFFVSQEMGKKELTRRMVALIANVKAKSLKNKTLTSDEWARVMSAKQIFKKYKFKIYDKGNMNIELLHTIVGRLKKQNKIDVLIVDYLQLISTRKSKFNRTSEVEEVSRQMKQIAMEYGLPVIVLSQFSRSVVNADGRVREPQKSDLKGSSSIEQDANIILLLHTDDMKQRFQEKRFIDLSIKKQRDGVLGKTHFNYFGDYNKFVETEWNTNEKRYIETTIEDLPF